MTRSEPGRQARQNRRGGLDRPGQPDRPSTGRRDRGTVHSMATENSEGVAKVLEMMSEHSVEYVDLRFTDPRGKWQHTAQHVSTINEDAFRDGIMFDGSSIAGWKAINESDMILMPDASTAVMDPFAAKPSLILFCDIFEPSTGQPYRARPAQHRQEGRGLRQEHRHRRHGDGRRGGRVLRVRRRPLRHRAELRQIRDPERRGAGLQPARLPRGQHGPPAGGQGRLFPGPAGGQRERPAGRDAVVDGRDGAGDREAPPRGGAEPARAGHQVQHAGQHGRPDADL